MDELDQLPDASPAATTQPSSDELDSLPDVAQTIKAQVTAPDAAKALIRGLSAPSQTVQAALANAYQTAVPANNLANKKPVGSLQDLKDALSGNGPEFDEYLSRAGGPQLKGAKKVLANMLAGAATDPLSLVGSSAGSAVDTALNPMARAAESVAYPVFRGGVAKADEAAVKQGAELLPSKVLFDEGVYGTPKTMRKGAQDIAQKELGNRENIYSQMAPIDTGNIDYSDAHRAIQKFLNNPFTSGSASKVSENLDELANRGLLTPQQLSDSKSVLMDLAKRSGAYGADPSLSAQAIGSNIAGGAEKGALEQGAEAAIPGGGKQLADTNQKLGALLGSQQPMSTMEAIAARKSAHLPTVVDFMYGPGVAISSHNPAAGAAATLIKKIGDLSRTTSGRTGTGIGLKNLSKSTMPDAALRNLWNQALSQRSQNQ